MIIKQWYQDYCNGNFSIVNTIFLLIFLIALILSLEVWVLLIFLHWMLWHVLLLISLTFYSPFLDWLVSQGLLNYRSTGIICNSWQTPLSLHIGLAQVWRGGATWRHAPVSADIQDQVGPLHLSCTVSRTLLPAWLDNHSLDLALYLHLSQHSFWAPDRLTAGVMVYHTCIHT